MILIDEISPLLYTHMRSTQMWWNGKYSEKKGFLSNIARKGGGALPPQPAVVYFFQADVLSSMANGAMVYKKWQSRCWRRSSNLPPHTFFRNIYFRKMKTDKYQVWFYHGSDKPWSDHICRSRAAGGCGVCLYFLSSGIQRSRVVNFWNVHHGHCWAQLQGATKALRLNN